jgi:hypothetical protein
MRGKALPGSGMNRFRERAVNAGARCEQTSVYFAAANAVWITIERGEHCRIFDSQYRRRDFAFRELAAHE